MIELPADPLDRAADAEESQRQESIKAVLSMPTLPKNGFCLWCKEPVLADASFCDSDCAGDWHKAARMKGR